MKTAKDPQRVEQERESVRQTASQLTGEATSVVHLAARSVTYGVADRWRRGSPRGTTPAARWLHAALTAVIVVLMLPVAIVASLLSEVGIDPTARRSGKISVHGKGSASALPFADALRDAPRSTWLTWSKSQVALLTMEDHGPRVLWRSADGERPKVQVAKSKIVWDDGSRVEFPLSAGERDRVVQRNGTP